MQQVDFLPSSLARVKNKYYVVVTVPAPLRDELGKQIRRSTGTSDQKIAAAKQHEITEAIYSIFREKLRVSKFGLTNRFMKEEGISGTLQEDDLEAIEHILSVAKLKRATNTSQGFDSDSQAIAELEQHLQQTHNKDSGGTYVPQKTLSSISELYFQEVTTTRDKSKKTRERHIKEFIDLVGDLEVDKLEKLHVYNFAKVLDREGQANKTITSKIASLRSLMSWCEREGIIKASPLVNLQLSTYGRSPESYRPIPVEILKDLFRGSPKSSKERSLLACLLLSGCRLDELATATSEQLKTTPEGIPYLDLSDSIVKNQGSQRYVPLHPYVSKTLRGSQGRLFDYPLDSDGKAQNAASKALLRLLRRYTDNKLHVVHSLRGNLKDELRDLGVAKEVNDAITGHSSGDVAGRYGAGPSVKVRYEAICKIDEKRFGL